MYSMSVRCSYGYVSVCMCSAKENKWLPSSGRLLRWIEPNGYAIQYVIIWPMHYIIQHTLNCCFNAISSYWKLLNRYVRGCECECVLASSQIHTYMHGKEHKNPLNHIVCVSEEDFRYGIILGTCWDFFLSQSKFIYYA